MIKPRHNGRGFGREYQNALASFYSTPKHTAQSIKSAIDPGAFYAAELPDMKPTRRRGWTDGGLCPFHADTRPGSWKINTETGAYRCFSCGESGGDVIAFAMARHGLTFPDALERLATEWGIV